MTIGERIKFRREELGMSQEELAHKIGSKSRSAVNKIETGANQLKQKKIMDIAMALDTTPAYIMGWSDEEQKMEEEIERLLSLRYGKETSKIIQTLLSLNKNDRLIAYGEMLGMLRKDSDK